LRLRAGRGRRSNTSYKWRDTSFTWRDTSFTWRDTFFNGVIPLVNGIVRGSFSRGYSEDGKCGFFLFLVISFLLVYCEYVRIHTCVMWVRACNQIRAHTDMFTSTYSHNSRTHMP
jgi:hypothetical protein